MATNTNAATPSTKKQVSLEKIVRAILVVGGAIALYCSAILTYDKLELLKNPSFQPGCNLNPVLSCGNVMSSNQGSVFGFPNPWIGLAAFAALVTVGMAMFAGATFKRWFWLCLAAGTVFGLGFALWLLYESMYTIKALCPYCLGVDVVVITLFWYLSLYLIESKRIGLPQKLEKPFGFARRHHLDILLGVFVVIIAVILQHFWYYYGQFFS